jgi:hypothetical protein
MRKLPCRREGRLASATTTPSRATRIRFNRGDTELRLDDEWRQAMILSSKFAMTSLTWHGLARYGFELTWAS